LQIRVFKEVVEKADRDIDIGVFAVLEVVVFSDSRKISFFVGIGRIRVSSSETVV